MNKPIVTLTSFIILLSLQGFAQKRKPVQETKPAPPAFFADKFKAMQWRNVGPFRGGRTNAVTGVPGDPITYYFGSTGGGIWKTEDAGLNWRNVSDGFFKSSSVGAIAVAPGDANVLYAGMGEHAVRGVMTSHGDGVYKSTDAGKTWKHSGLPHSRHIAAIRVHPQNHDLVYAAVQGALFGPSEHRGVYRSKDGGSTWEKILYLNENTGACDLSMDPANPRILYAGMWDHQRYPWKVRSGGKGSGIWKSTDGGNTWVQLKNGLPEKMGKLAVSVSPANPNRVYANIEAEKGGVFRSDDGGNSWQQTNSQRLTVGRAWYYIEIFADPVNPDLVYVLNSPFLKSIDGGKTFASIPIPHVDQHDLWINPQNPANMILGNDGGACITFNGGASWSTQGNQPTAQFYRIIADRRFPYHLYAGQQDNSSVCIASRTRGRGIGESDWYPVAGCESAFLAFNPQDPKLVYGTCIQGSIDVYDHETNLTKEIMPYPMMNLGRLPNAMKYRFNWNPPIVAQPQNPGILYYGGNVLFRTADGAQSWQVVSPDLTRNDTTKHGAGGEPFTNEAAGGEVYNTISYITCSPHRAGTIWVGTDDGLVHLTQDDGKNWRNVTPAGLGESLINAIEASPHEPGTAYLAVTRYKFDDLSPMIFKTKDYGATWQRKERGIDREHFVRVVREDPVRPGLLYAGTERGIYISLNGGDEWFPFQSNLPACPVTDLAISDNDLVASTSGRAFWILDDLGALQQSSGKPDTTKLTFFKPKPTVKFTVETPPQPVPGEGQNPLNGVTLDYYLPHNWVDSNLLTLQVLDAAGKVIRTLTNQKPKDFKTWTGGPPPPQVIPAKAGLNRTSWDMRRETLPGIEGVFVMGDYRGHLVAPGNYRLRLMTAKDTAETTCTILADPRLKASPGAHALQQELLLQIEGMVNDVHNSVIRLRSVKKQLAERLALLKKMDGMKELSEKGEAVQKAIVAWEEKLIQPKQESFQDVINFQNQLNVELLNLSSQIDAHDPHPTAGAQERLKDLTDEWDGWKKEMERLISGDVGGFNEAYLKKGLPVLIVPD
jgi:photosystem II stability/assembly factor-like uncharacterized protein